MVPVMPSSATSSTVPTIRVTCPPPYTAHRSVRPRHLVAVVTQRDFVLLAVLAFLLTLILDVILINHHVVSIQVPPGRRQLRAVRATKPPQLVVEKHPRNLIVVTHPHLVPRPRAHHRVRERARRELATMDRPEILRAGILNTARVENMDRHRSTPTVMLVPRTLSVHQPGALRERDRTIPVDRSLSIDAVNGAVFQVLRSSNGLVGI